MQRYLRRKTDTAYDGTVQRVEILVQLQEPLGPAGEKLFLPKRPPSTLRRVLADLLAQPRPLQVAARTGLSPVLQEPTCRLLQVGPVCLALSLIWRRVA